jgi:hypothetical protein
MRSGLSDDDTCGSPANAIGAWPPRSRFPVVALWNDKLAEGLRGRGSARVYEGAFDIERHLQSRGFGVLASSVDPIFRRRTLSSTVRI